MFNLAPGKTNFHQRDGLRAVLHTILLKSPITEDDHVKAYSLLKSILQCGRVYKELFCASDGVIALAESLRQNELLSTLERGRALLVEVGVGNPRYQGHVETAVCRLLVCSNPLAQRTAAQVHTAQHSTAQHMCA